MNQEYAISKNVLEWLLEPDSPGVRYLALRDLLNIPSDSSEILAAQARAHRDGPIREVLDAMDPAGYWMEPGPGYYPKYRSTVWSLSLLAQLGPRLELDERIAQACDYILEVGLTPAGQFTASGAPSGTADCLQGNLAWALLELGCTDPRLELAYDWIARSQTGEGVAAAGAKQAAVRYYASGKCGPHFACGSNDRQPCAWGAVKVMLALGRLPEARRTPLIQKAIGQGVDFLLGTDPALAEYPHPYAHKPSGNWWKFGFPVFYVTDLLQSMEALMTLGLEGDPRLANARALIWEKQDPKGRWAMEYAYTGKTWVDFGPQKAPNKWVTLRALRILKVQPAPGIPAA